MSYDDIASEQTAFMFFPEAPAQGAQYDEESHVTQRANPMRTAAHTTRTGPWIR